MQTSKIIPTVGTQCKATRMERGKQNWYGIIDKKTRPKVFLQGEEHIDSAITSLYSEKEYS